MLSLRKLVNYFQAFKNTKTNAILLTLNCLKSYKF